MRPLRFLLLLTLFVVLPVVLTCVSLFSGEKVNPETFNVGYHSRSGRFRALWSFSTPSSFWPPSAIISLTDDNTTSFLARPAAFGPSLPSHGLSGQLWIGKGFGEEALLSEEDLIISGFELGCSDVPGWNEDHKNRAENGAVDGKSANSGEKDTTNKADAPAKSPPSKRDAVKNEDEDVASSGNDGTDDHLHYPLPDSNPTTPEKPGEPASNTHQDKTKQPTHADIESLQESADIAGKIVMLSRGGCGFLEKVKWAQRRGGVAVIVGDNEPGGPLTVMYAKGDTSNVTIPSIFTSYYSAHLLSTLVPSEEILEIGSDGKSLPSKDGKSKTKGKGSNPKSKGTHGTQPAKPKKADPDTDADSDKGWMQNVLSAVGLEGESDTNGDDSRRPPASGNIDWVLLEDWDEDKPATVSTNIQTLKALKTAGTSSKNAKPQTTSIKKSGNDDFIIGVQDWRDTELIAPKSTTTKGSQKHKGKAETTTSQASTSTSSINPTATALKGGSITPGSGEYDHQRDAVEKGKQGRASRTGRPGSHAEGQEHQSLGAKIASFFRSGPPKEIVHPRPDERSHLRHAKGSKGNLNQEAQQKTTIHQGLWVTLTPATQSSSPFFDTLLVLVVSPLVTLTFVYALLLLRSRIRRRRWRAPKSIVERLPVRTYHTMSSTSSTTSSSLSSPQPSANSSPTLGPASHTRIRPRSQTTTGVITASTPTEKSTIKSSPKRKRYNGRQVECVVCLEEYVDGESKVMSLPCGHEFHAECITPWLVTRRRTCPICKGDVVRSLRSGDQSTSLDQARENVEETSDDIQDQVAMTENQNGSAAIPIPVPAEEANNDIERGADAETPLMGSTLRAQQGRWRNIINNSLGRLSGDTVWRSSVNDRTR